MYNYYEMIARSKKPLFAKVMARKDLKSIFLSLDGVILGQFRGKNRYKLEDLHLGLASSVIDEIRSNPDPNHESNIVSDFLKLLGGNQ